MSAEDGVLIAQNKKARHDYAVLETFEAGMVLKGTEIKAIRNRRVNLKDGYVRVKDGQAFLVNVHISPYEQGNLFNHDALRTRKLLLHKKQISKLIGESKNNGVTIIPLKIYIKNGFAKVLIGIAKGKRQYDKRHDLKQKDMNREINRALKSRQR